MFDGLAVKPGAGKVGINSADRSTNAILLRVVFSGSSQQLIQAPYLSDTLSHVRGLLFHHPSKDISTAKDDNYWGHCRGHSPIARCLLQGMRHLFRVKTVQSNTSLQK
jgi:hypothetical protein